MSLTKLAEIFQGSFFKLQYKEENLSTNLCIQIILSVISASWLKKNEKLLQTEE